MSNIQIPENRTVIENVRWKTYVALAKQRRGNVPRMCFDKGVLEMTSPGQNHENIGSLIGRIVETYSEVKNIDLLTVASTTFKRKELQKAFEADESY
jgi:Uma2 family endonuclease